MHIAVQVLVRRRRFLRAEAVNAAGLAERKRRLAGHSRDEQPSDSTR